jgi:hypothetical protein
MPNAIARSINSLNHGAAVEIFHIGLVSEVDPPPDGDTAKQALVYGNGRRAPWHGQYATVFKNLPRGTVMRPVTSSDRPSGMDPLYAEHMIRSPGKNPRLQVASGKRPDGKWYLAAVNTTQGRGINASHVGACFPAATLQVTTQIVELAARDGVFRSTRHNASGMVVSSREYPMRDGLVRFTLAPGELIVMVGG